MKTRPKIEVLHVAFMKKVSIKGTVKSVVYDYSTVFIDFSDETDCKIFYFRRSLEIEGMIMWLEMWSPDFRPEHDSPLVHVWVSLPELSFHCHTWYYVKQILGPVGTPLSMDLATNGRTRPSMAKVRVEIDITKPQPNSVWVGQEDEAFPLKGFTQN